MTGSERAKAPHRLVVLRQVNPLEWCVVIHQVRDGRRCFAARIATARPYREACRIARQTAESGKLTLGVEGLDFPLRGFAPELDMPSAGVHA